MDKRERRLKSLNEIPPERYFRDPVVPRELFG